MDARLWQRIQDIFDRAVEQPAAERVPFVEREAGDDPLLAREVLALLASWEDDPDYLETGSELLGAPRRGDASAGLGASPDADPLIGTQVGPWRIAHRLGEGGMGVVYRAERADGAYEQSVAIKVVRRGLDTEHLLQRFRSERRILAALDHPDIARPIDAGALPDGRPYLAMEYVEGERIDLHCQRNNLGLRTRLDLFLAVCEAVDHAHRRSVIHRDLKPANLLVTRDGRVKLLDFGVAKLLDADDPGAESTLTQADLRPLTPDYASPEQLRGETITTSSDVYSLGVLLYELLTGRRPFDRASRPMAEWTSGALQADAPRPSRATTMLPAASLAGDLDAVILTALHVDPQRRYESPRALAEDLRRHLVGLPVRAREDSAVYRVRRFVGRHRIGVGIAAAFLTTFIVAGALLVRQVDRTEHERIRAERERASAEQVVQLLIDVFETSNPGVVPEGDSMPVGAFLDRAARDVDRLEDQPDVQVRAWLALAGIHMARSRLDVADSILTRAAEIVGTLPEPDLALFIEVAHTRGQLWSWQGRLEEARAILSEVADQYEQRGDEQHLAAALLELSQVADPNERRRLLERSLTLAERYEHEDPKLLASVLNGLASDSYERQDLDVARDLYARAEELLLRVVDEDHPDLLTVRHNLAAVRSATGDYSGAEAAYRVLLASRSRVVGERTTAVAAAHSGMAVALAQQGRHAEAQPHFETSCELFEELLGDAHPRVALEWRSLARSHELQEHWAEALAAHEHAYEVIQRAEGVGDQDRAWYLASRIAALAGLGRTDEARSVALRVLVNPGSETTRRGADILFATARVLGERRRELLEQCYAMRAQWHAKDDPRLGEVACALGVQLVASGDVARGRELLESGIASLGAWPLALDVDKRQARAALAGLEGAGR